MHRDSSDCPLFSSCPYFSGGLKDRFHCTCICRCISIILVKTILDCWDQLITRQLNMQCDEVAFMLRSSKAICNQWEKVG